MSPGGGMVDTGDLKSPGHCDRAGSSPAPGTTIYRWSHSQVLRQQRCNAEIPLFNSGWLLQLSTTFYLF